jgi:hypothetical protein
MALTGPPAAPNTALGAGASDRVELATLGADGIS